MWTPRGRIHTQGMQTVACQGTNCVRNDGLTLRSVAPNIAEDVISSSRSAMGVHTSSPVGIAEPYYSSTPGSLGTGKEKSRRAEHNAGVSPPAAEEVVVVTVVLSQRPNRSFLVGGRVCNCSVCMQRPVALLHVLIVPKPTIIASSLCIVLRLVVGLLPNFVCRL